MTKVLDLRSNGGEYVILGDSITLPMSYASTTPMPGSLRYNPTTYALEIYSATLTDPNINWISVNTGSSGSNSSVTLPDYFTSTGAPTTFVGGDVYYGGAVYGNAVIITGISANVNSSPAPGGLKVLVSNTSSSTLPLLNLTTTSLLLTDVSNNTYVNLSSATSTISANLINLVSSKDDVSISINVTNAGQSVVETAITVFGLLELNGQNYNSTTNSYYGGLILNSGTFSFDSQDNFFINNGYVEFNVTSFLINTPTVNIANNAEIKTLYAKNNIGLNFTPMVNGLITNNSVTAANGTVYTDFTINNTVNTISYSTNISYYGLTFSTSNTIAGAGVTAYLSDQIYGATGNDGPVFTTNDILNVTLKLLTTNAINYGILFSDGTGYLINSGNAATSTPYTISSFTSSTNTLLISSTTNSNITITCGMLIGLLSNEIMLSGTKNDSPVTSVSETGGSLNFRIFCDTLPISGYSNFYIN